jgi:hypothetical protein
MAENRTMPNPDTGFIHDQSEHFSLIVRIEWKQNLIAFLPMEINSHGLPDGQSRRRDISSR